MALLTESVLPAQSTSLIYFAVSLTDYVDYSAPNIKFPEYSAIKRIGQGSVGHVLLIEHKLLPDLPRRMALKRLLLPVKEDDKLREIKRIQSEMKIMIESG